MNHPLDLWTAEELSCQEISNRFVTSNDSHFTMCTLTMVSLTLKRQLPCCCTERRNLQLAISGTGANHGSCELRTSPCEIAPYSQPPTASFPGSPQPGLWEVCMGCADCSY